MSEKLIDEELIFFKEMVTANSIQLDSLAQLLVENELNTEDELYWKLKKMQMKYKSNGKQKVEREALDRPA